MALLYCLFICSLVFNKVVFASSGSSQLKKSKSSSWFFKGSTISFTCIIVNVNQNQMIVWSVDNVELSNSSNYDHVIKNFKSGSTRNSTLTFNNASKFTHKSRRVDVSCAVEENGEKGTTKFFSFWPIDSKNLPNVTVSARSVKLNYGDAVSLSCHVRGNLLIAKLNVSWTKDNAVLEQVEQDEIGKMLALSLTIKHAKGSSGGIYECRAMKNVNDYLFRDNDTVTLTVFPKLIGPSNVTRYYSIGGKITVTCAIDGYPLTITWQKKTASGMQNVLDGGRFQIENNGRTLTISSLKKQDITDFICKTKGKNDDIVQQTTLVEKVFPSLNNSSNNETAVLIPGRSFTFKCNIEATPLCVVWDGHEVDSGRKLNVTGIPGISPPAPCSRTLLVTNVSKLAGGKTFSCSYGGVVQTFRTDIMTKPVLHGPESKEVKVKSGDDVTLRCDITVNPLVIAWSVENQPITEADERYKVSKHDALSLSINDVDYGDRRSFYCSTKNELDKDGVSQEIILRVKGRRAFLWPVIGIIIVAVIVATIIGISYYWKKRKGTETREGDRGDGQGDGVHYDATHDRVCDDTDQPLLTTSS